MTLSKSKKSKKSKSKSRSRKHRRYSDESDSTDSEEEDRRRRRRREKRRKEADRYSDQDESHKPERRRRETTEPETDSEEERDQRRRRKVSRSKSRLAMSPSGKGKETDWIEKDAEGVVGRGASASVVPDIESDDDGDLVGPQLPVEPKERAKRLAYVFSTLIFLLEDQKLNFQVQGHVTRRSRSHGRLCRFRTTYSPTRRDRSRRK